MNRLLKIILSLIILVSGSFDYLAAQDSKSFYEQKNFGNNIIYELIEHVLVDSDGFIWIATSTGLHYYDGYEFNLLQQTSQEPHFVPLYYVIRLFEDSTGNIWIFTLNDGICVYNKKDKSFYNYQNNPDDSASISSQKLSRELQLVTEDEQNGTIWFNTENGLNAIEHEDREIKRFHGDLDGHIMYDPQRNSLWIADNRLKLFDPNTNELQIFEDQTEYTKNPEIIHTTFFDDNGLIWIGSDNGLQLFDTQELKYIDVEAYLKDKLRFEPEAFNWLDNSVTAIYQDFRGRMWIGSEKSIYIISRETGKFSKLRNGEVENYGIINGIYGSENGTVFITLDNRNIIKINANVQSFEKITSLFEGKNVRSIAKDADNNLWVGTGNSGLFKLIDSNPEKYIQYQHNPDDNTSLNSNYITAIHIDAYQRLWLGSFKDGFCFADGFSETGQLFFERSNFDRKVEIHEFTEGPDGNLWISTESGFYIHNRKLDTLIHYGDFKNQLKEVQNINIQSVIHNPPNEFWLATWNKGVCKLIINSDSLLSSRVAKDSIVYINQIRNIDGKLLDNRFISILQDQNNTLWLASFSDGLVKLDITNPPFKFNNYGKSSGAPSNTVNAIINDHHGNIWVSTLKGLAKFDPIDERFFSYHEIDGLHSNSFIWDSYYQEENGKMYFGGINGITSFYPDSIRNNIKSPKSYISRLTINHKEIEVGEKVNNRILLTEDIRYTKSLTLTHKEPVFTLEFAALDINNASEVIFAYKLDGFDSDWIEATSDNRVATYTNLEKGTYQFMVKATTALGVWLEEPAIMEIEILPPWWKTYWAYALYLTIFLVLLYLFQLELKKRSSLQHQMQLEHYQHEKENELNKDKFQFFTNLSHEFRTPLTLILGPIDRMIDNNEGNNRVHQNLILIRKQAERLEKLTNQFLNFRKFERDNLQLKTAEGDIIEYLKEMALAFRQHANIKSINFQYNPDPPELRLYYDRDKLEIIVTNLLSNAFKFTPPRSSVELKVTTTSREQIEKMINRPHSTPYTYFGDIKINLKKWVQIEVKDNGIGIEPEQLQHVFDRYYQSGNPGKITSSGIGLEITKNYVELHSGCILVSSAREQGTNFYVWLPLGKAHLRADQIINDFIPSEDSRHYSFIEEAEDEAYLQQPSKKEPVTSTLNGLPLLLIVDDNKDIVSFLKNNFQNNFRIETAKNGKEGLKKASELIPDIIISDIIMPEIDGLEFCASIKKDVRTSHIPVVLVTARTSTVFQAEGLETGADDYITKPFDVKLLNLRIRNLLDSRKKLQARYSDSKFINPEEITFTKPDELFLNRVIDIIEHNISDPSFKVEILTKELGMSHSVLYKKIMALTNLTIIEYVRTIKLKKASQLLQQNHKSINEVSHLVGFTDPKYFSRSFKEFYGSTPSDYRKKQGKI